MFNFALQFSFSHVKKILFLHPYPFNTAGGQRFRYEQYIKYLEQNGFECIFQSFLTLAAWQVLYEPGGSFKKMYYVAIGFLRRFKVLFSKADYVFIFRETTPIGPPIFEFILAKVLKKKIIYDFDDAIWLENTTSENSIASKLKWHSKVSSICEWSHKISAGNKFLVDYARLYSDSVFINPTTIDTDYHVPIQKKENHKVVIGWTGTHSTIKYLNLLIEPLNRIKKAFDVEFMFISDRAPELDLEFTFITWSETTEITDLQKMDIGIMPLNDTIWEKGKCGFKALQYMGIGIPTLVSPVGVNTKIVDHKINGFHCNTELDWEKYLKFLILNPGIRKKLGNNGREKVIRQYSVESNKENFLSLFF